MADKKEQPVVEYMELIAVSDSVGHKWTTRKLGGEFTGYNDMTLLYVLNILGNDGWGLCSQNGSNYYILKRQAI